VVEGDVDAPGRKLVRKGHDRFPRFIEESGSIKVAAAQGYNRYNRFNLLIVEREIRIKIGEIKLPAPRF
jgi:hypothetical protein